MGGSVKDVQTKSELHNLIKNGAPLILHFWEPCCEASKPMDKVFLHLSIDFPQARFLRRRMAVIHVDRREGANAMGCELDIQFFQHAGYSYELLRRLWLCPAKRLRQLLLDSSNSDTRFVTCYTAGRIFAEDRPQQKSEPWHETRRPYASCDIASHYSYQPCSFQPDI